MGKRHYRTQRNRFFAYPFGGLAIVVGLIVILAPRGGLAIHISAAGCLAFVLWLIRNALRLGIATDEGGVVVYGPISAQRVTWGEIAGLDTHRWSINQIVDLQLVDGRKLNTNLIQGASVTWHGGKTSDILDVLGKELNCRTEVRAGSGSK